MNNIKFSQLQVNQEFILDNKKYIKSGFLSCKSLDGNTLYLIFPFTKVQSKIIKKPKEWQVDTIKDGKKDQYPPIFDNEPAAKSHKKDMESLGYIATIKELY